ncbi:aconitate hydratase AcnA [uncultured Tateyamaria sp.]|uniref:aconitate hydratase AcnA n=1 Tax=uncultured Tateyamaria sp. TaxID=455651 RepID=UPI002634C532|nr:aconitate hydratase AcnA [uncultured Tateyamaria sp.]
MQLQTIKSAGQELRVVDLRAALGGRLDDLPVCIRLLCENHIRSGAPLEPFLQGDETFEFAFRPNRLLMHDTTCTPALADVAGLRDALAGAGVDPTVLSPTLPVDVSVDHSVAVDAFGVPDALQRNLANEFARNSERYAFLKWASRTMDGLRVHPPGSGIMHTINLEQLATVLEVDPDGISHPDMLLGTDSHTTMINGIGLMAWGIGGLEAESVMFGQAVSLAVPKTVGVRLSGQMPRHMLATDLALEITHRLRAFGVTGEFVEFFGPGVSQLGADTRGVVANMAPEFGASTGYFPVDAETIAYLKRTGRKPVQYQHIEAVFRAMGLWFDPDACPRYDRTLDLDLSAISPAIAGPRRPQDRCKPAQAAGQVEIAIGRSLMPISADTTAVPDGAVGIAAITSCTNTSDPNLLVAAGLLARNARRLGLGPAPWVKTSLAPGSPSARKLLDRAGLMEDLSALGFDIVGFGCTTCIGNSGPLPAAIETALADGKAIAAVLSGNRNFPGRVHPKLDLGDLTSPPLVIAYALKGDIAGDILTDSLGIGTDGQDVMLEDIWPSPEDIAEALSMGYRSEDVKAAFATAAQDATWSGIATPDTPLFPWDPVSSYLRCPKFASHPHGTRLGRYDARALMVLGDDVTTDHISPAGWIAPNSAAGQWLIARGGDPDNLNVYAAYRGNWEVMLRGLFTNRSVKNHLAEGLEPSETMLGDGRVLPLHEAANELENSGLSAVIFAGDRYGMGSSRDWAAKGVALLGVKAVIAKSFERIHRTNLIGMGVLPLEITDGFDPATARIGPADQVLVDLSGDALTPRKETAITLKRTGKPAAKIACRAAVETEQEIALLRVGGVLPNILGMHLR